MLYLSYIYIMMLNTRRMKDIGERAINKCIKVAKSTIRSSNYYCDKTANVIGIGFLQRNKHSLPRNENW